eukprot:361323-Chlamydomonas_euryale.AAC.4
MPVRMRAPLCLCSMLLLEMFLRDELGRPLASSSPGLVAQGVAFYAARRTPERDEAPHLTVGANGVIQARPPLNTLGDAFDVSLMLADMYTDAAGIGAGGSTAQRIVLPVGELVDMYQDEWPQRW